MARSLDEMLDHPADPARLVIDPDVWRRLMSWALATDSEVSGMGLLQPDGDDGYRLARVFLLPQSGNAMSTQLDPMGMADLMSELIDQEVDPSGLRVWWHSHGREAPFWSGQDEHTIEGFAPVRMISLVIDHRQRRLARLDQFAPRATAWLVIDGADPIDSWADDEVANARAEVRKVVGRLAEEARLRPGTGQ